MDVSLQELEQWWPTYSCSSLPLDSEAEDPLQYFFFKPVSVMVVCAVALMVVWALGGRSLMLHAGQWVVAGWIGEGEGELPRLGFDDDDEQWKKMWCVIFL